MKNVCVVLELGHYPLLPEGYSTLAEAYKAALETEEGVSVEIVDTMGEAHEVLAAGQVAALVFLSNSMAEVAEVTAKAYPGVRVVGFSADPPQNTEGDVVWSRKGAVHALDLARVVLGE